MTSPTTTLADADRKLARRFADSIYDEKVDPPARSEMLRLVELGLLTEVAPGQFAETPALRAHGF